MIILCNPLQLMVESYGVWQILQKSQKAPIYIIYIRDRPFNLKGGGLWFFVLFRFFFRTTQELEYFFLSRKARIFFPQFNIGLYDKNSESDYFIPPP
jgi:hypothetical protein